VKQVDEKNAKEYNKIVKTNAIFVTAKMALF